MLRAMFGMGGTEILVILVVALLFLGPEKLPEAASKISKGIRDIRRQTRDLQQTIENDTEIGGAIRDLKSALRGDEPRPKLQPQKPVKEPKPIEGAAGAAIAAAAGAEAPGAALPPPIPGTATPPPIPGTVAAPSEAAAAAPSPSSPITMPELVGEAEPVAEAADDSDDVAGLIRPAAGTVAKGEPKAS